MTATLVKERPILFSAPMVRAILDGRKTQTRRIVKPQPPADSCCPIIGSYGVDWDYCGARTPASRNPYGVQGNCLWVRETFDIVDDPAAYHKDDGPREVVEYEGEIYECDDAVRRGPNGERWVVDYAATPPRRAMDVAGVRKWRPSIHMPRWASRITLEIESVRVERVQEISEADAAAEGVGGMRDMRFAVALGNLHSTAHRPNFADLWNSINGSGSWELNPWVWVLTFKRVTP